MSDAPQWLLEMRAITGLSETPGSFILGVDRDGEPECQIVQPPRRLSMSLHERSQDDCYSCFFLVVCGSPTDNFQVSMGHRYHGDR